MKKREELVAAIATAQAAFAADQSDANANALAKAQSELEAYDKANPPSNPGNSGSGNTGYGEREFDNTIIMPVLQITTDPFEIKRADGTIGRKVGGVVLRTPIVMSNGKKLRMLPLSAEQARRLLQASGVAKSLKELAMFVVPGETQVFVDHLVGVSDSSEAFLPQRVYFKGEAAVAAELIADAKRRAASEYQYADVEELD